MPHAPAKDACIASGTVTSINKLTVVFLQAYGGAETAAGLLGGASWTCARQPALHRASIRVEASSHICQAATHKTHPAQYPATDCHAGPGFPKQSSFSWPMQAATSTSWSGQQSKHFWLGNSIPGWAAWQLWTVLNTMLHLAAVQVLCHPPPSSRGSS